MLAPMSSSEVTQIDPWHHRFEITTYETTQTHALLQ